MLISRDMGVKGCFSQPKIFKIIFSFLGQKIAFKNIYHTLEDFSKFDLPFKSTVISLYALKIRVKFENLTKQHCLLKMHDL